MHKPLSKVSQLGRRGFLGLAALSDSLLSRKRVVRALLAKDGSVQDW